LVDDERNPEMSQSRAEARVEASRRGRNRFILTVVLVVVVVIVIIVAGIALAHSRSETLAETHLLASIAASRVAGLVSLSLGIDWVFSPPIAIIVGVVASSSAHGSAARSSNTSFIAHARPRNWPTRSSQTLTQTAIRAVTCASLWDLASPSLFSPSGLACA
jgi:hypothetical protein